MHVSFCVVVALLLTAEYVVAKGPPAGKGSKEDSQENKASAGKQSKAVVSSGECPIAAISPYCPKPKDCSEVLDLGYTDSGLYTIYVGSKDKPVEVYCDQETDGGGWLVFQRRQDGHENFNRGWTDYDTGFGDLYGEFWLGNHFLNLISEQDDYTIRVDLDDFSSGTAYAQYSHFSVGTAFLKYPITVSGYDDDSTAGDSLAYHAGMKFSTYDQDNDIHSTNCASVYKSGWWYKGCWQSNLNGEYLGGPVTEQWTGIQWKAWKGDYYSLKTTEMKIRPSGM